MSKAARNTPNPWGDTPAAIRAMRSPPARPCPPARPIGDATAPKGASPVRQRYALATRG